MQYPVTIKVQNGEEKEFWLSDEKLKFGGGNEYNDSEVRDEISQVKEGVAQLSESITDIGNEVDGLKSGKADKSELAEKLTKPTSDVAVGKYFRVASIDGEGNPVLEAVDLPIANEAVAGVAKIRQYLDGLYVNDNGRLEVFPASVSLIDTKSLTSRPITPNLVDRAIRAGLISNSQITDADKPLICETIGAESDGVANLVDEFTLSTDQSYFSRNLTNVGLPYNFSRVFVSCVLPSTSDNKGKEIAIGINVNSGDTSYMSNASLLRVSFRLNNTEGGKTAYFVDVKKEHGIIRAIAGSDTSVSSLDNSNPISTIRTSNKVLLGNRITSITLTAYNGYAPIPAGTMVKIYAY